MGGYALFHRTDCRSVDVPLIVVPTREKSPSESIVEMEKNGPPTVYKSIRSGRRSPKPPLLVHQKATSDWVTALSFTQLGSGHFNKQTLHMPVDLTIWWVPLGDPPPWGSGPSDLM